MIALALALSLLHPNLAPPAPPALGEYVLQSPVPGSAGDAEGSVAWRIAGTPVGAIAGAMTGGQIGAVLGSGAGTRGDLAFTLAGLAVGAAGGGVGGYFVGRAADDGSTGAKVSIVAVGATELLLIGLVWLVASAHQG